jgi:hypothetical protein
MYVVSVKVMVDFPKSFSKYSENGGRALISSSEFSEIERFAGSSANSAYGLTGGVLNLEIA